MPKKNQTSQSTSGQSPLKHEGKLHAIGMSGRKILIYITAELYTNPANGYARLVFKTKKARTKFLRELREGRRMKALIRDLDSLGIKLGLIDLISGRQTSYCLWLQLADPSGAKVNFYTA